MTDGYACQCGAVHTWQAEHAKLVFQCGCGRVFSMPGHPPRGQPTLKPLTKAQPTHRACPMCLTLQPIEARVCTKCGFDREEGRRAYVHKPRVKSEREKQFEAEVVQQEKRRLAAAGMTAALVAVVYLLALPMAPGLPWYLRPLLLAAWVLGGMVGMLVSARLMSRFVDFDLTDLWPTIVKLLATFLALHTTRGLAFDMVGLTQALLRGSGFIGGFGQAFYIVTSLLACGFVIPSVVILACVRWFWDASPTDSLTAWLFLILPNLAVAVCLKAAGLPG
jgi:ribosomal protein L37E